MKQLTITSIKMYQLCLSSLLPFNNCRFYPSCSQFAVEAVEKHGVLRGLWLIANRVLHCHPLSSKHGYDPVP